MRRRVVLPLLALPLLALTACGPVGVENTSTSAQSMTNPALASAQAAQSSAAAAASEAAASASEAAAAPAPFGDTKTFTDGIAVSVAAPTPYTPSETAAGASPGAAAFEVQVKVSNGSSVNFDPSLIQVSAQSGGVESSEIYDAANNLGGTPNTTLPPGGSVTFPVAFTGGTIGVIVQVTPGFNYSPALFEG